MRLLAVSKQGPASTRTRRARRSIASPLLAALALVVCGSVAAGVAWAGPAMAAKPTAGPKPTATAASTPTPEPTPEPEPTMSPFVAGRHVYDYGDVLSASSATLAESLASEIEARSGGRVVLYTTAQLEDLPDSGTLAQEWHVDSMLLTGSSDGFGTLTMGTELTTKLSAAQAGAIDTSPGQQTLESWMTTSLARVDAFLGGTHVFDGAGALDATGEQAAEAAARSLSSKLGAPVYIDIALGGDDPSSATFFNGAELSSDFDNAFIIALGVSGNEIAGYLQTNNSDLWDSYNAVAPWSATTLRNEAAPNGDVQAALLAAIDAVKSSSAASSSGPGGIGLETWFWVVFTILMVAIGVSSMFWGGWLIRRMTGTTTIKNGLPGDAVIESIADTGVTVSMSSVGAYAPEYKFGLQVTPSAGGAPYSVEAKALVPRIYIPMVVPGAHVGVLTDPTDPQKVSIDFSQMGSLSAGGAGAAGGAAGAAGGMDFQFDASGQPAAGEVSDLVGRVRGGTLPTIKGSADQLLATGTHGTAVITSAEPLGKTVRDINPNADPSRLGDPVWVFTVEVTVAGENPFPAVFGHRVPLAKLATVAPGVKLAIAVDMSDRHNEVAIDWDKSPIGA